MDARVHDPEEARLQRLYESLRTRLLDMTSRNPMLNYKHSATSKRQIQFVDASLEPVLAALTEGRALAILALPEPDDVPADEQTEDFASAFDHAKLTDPDYLKATESTAEPVSEDVLAQAERDLRDVVRRILALPDRVALPVATPESRAIELDIDPSTTLKASAGQAAPSALQTLKWPDKLEALAGKISADAKLSEQEQGLSTLYLAFGFLEWREAAGAKAMLAPLALLPASLEVDRSRPGKPAFLLRASADALEPNLSLITRLTELGIKLPTIDQTSAATSIEAYMEAVAEATAHMRDWRVRRMMTLGHFAFGRLAMYADLASSAWHEHPVSSELVRTIVRGVDSKEDAQGVESPEPYDVDDPAVERMAPMLIHDADASQHSAIVDVMRQRNLVIEGPPGTGKSQTITNVIAAAIGAGRSVLFLAEKQSALEVVKRRMDSAGLGEFCLELHSSKATSKKVVEALRKRADLPAPAMSSPIPQDAVWNACRTKVRDYVSALHAPQNGASPFENIWTYLRLRGVLGPQADEATLAELPPLALEGDGQLEEGMLSTYARTTAEFERDHGPLRRSPLNRLGIEDPASVSSSALIRDLSALHEADQALRGAIADLMSAIGGSAGEALAAPGLVTALDRLDPNAGFVARIAAVGVEDADRLIALLDDHARHAEAAAKVDVGKATDRHRSIALALVAAAQRAGMPEGPTASMRDAAVIRLKELQAQARAVEAAKAVVRASGGAGDPTAADLQGYGGLAAACSASSADALSWCHWEPEDRPAFDAFAKAWGDLARAEAKWRQRLPDFEERAWPSVRELGDAATHFAKGAMGRAMGLFDGTASSAKATARRLWATPEGALSAAELGRLAQHARTLTAFAKSEAHKAASGRHWKGLDTPVEAMTQGLALRAKLKEAVDGSVAAHAKRIANTADSAAIALLRDGAAHFALAIAACGGQPTGQPASVLVAALAKAATACAAVADADARGELDAFGATPSQIEAAIGARISRDAARISLERHALADLASEVLRRRVPLEAIQTARDWVAAVGAALPGARIASDLLGPGLAGAKASLKSATRTVADRKASCDAVAAALRSAHGAEGLPGDPALREALTRDAGQRGSEVHAYLSAQVDAKILQDAGLAPLMKAAADAGIAEARLPDLLRATRARKLADLARQGSEALRSATGQAIAGNRQEFADRDLKKIRADRLRIRQGLLSVPVPQGSSEGPKRDWTDMRLLRNEFAKEQRHPHIRKLIEGAGDAILALTPCMMMSPLSLAKFVPAGALTFDLVVIDEASQMRPEDALGGLLRARQLVVVGDQQQLPPTDFFSRSVEAEADDEDAQEAQHESILEACRKAYRNSRRLLWHYRSRCESLIAFSNAQFYDGRLITFPRAEPDSFSIDLVRVAGTCEARRNPAEAQHVCEAAAKFMRENAHFEGRDLQTLAIVAINADQAELIGDEIRRLRMRDPLIEQYAARCEAKGEELIVKNLENVQGDERDHVIVSMTYGPGRGSRAMLQRFGPINGAQGHRRLNVLFSRARARITVFSSFGSVDVRPIPGSSRGVLALKAYLEYVESRGRAIGAATGLAPDSDFEVDVARGLRAHGYEVDCQVGASGFRIDLGVRNPDAPGTYLAAVECDGATYHSSRSARDRDRLREEVLKGLGWTVLRVWSTDWFRDPDGQIGLLAKRLGALRQAAAPRAPAYKPIASAPVPPALPVAGPGPAEDESPEAAVGIGPETTGAILTHAPMGEPPLQAPAPADEAEPTIAAAPEPAPTPAVTAGAAAEATSPRREIQEAIRDGRLTPTAVAVLLRRFRDEVIAPASANWEPHRSILRESMIETMIAQRIEDPGDWHRKIPVYQRQGSNPVEKRLYFEDACDIVAAMQ